MIGSLVRFPYAPPAVAVFNSYLASFIVKFLNALTSSSDFKLLTCKDIVHISSLCTGLMTETLSSDVVRVRYGPLFIFYADFHNHFSNLCVG